MADKGMLDDEEHWNDYDNIESMSQADPAEYEDNFDNNGQ